MKAKGILLIAVACFVVANVAAISWGLCRPAVRLEAENTNQLPKTTGEYEPCEKWLIWEFDFWFWSAPGRTQIATYITPTDFYRYYDSDEQANGLNHFEGYDWDDGDTHQTVIDIAIGSGGSHFYYMDLYVHYAAGQPER